MLQWHVALDIYVKMKLLTRRPIEAKNMHQVSTERISCRKKWIIWNILKQPMHFLIDEIKNSFTFYLVLFNFSERFLGKKTLKNFKHLVFC